MRVFNYSIIASMIERVSIYIDGANFYLLALKKLNIHDAKFDFESFVNFLASGRSINSHGKRYYIGTVREKIGDLKSKEAISRQTSLFTRLTAFGWEVKTSKHRMRIEEIIVDSRVENWEKLKKIGIDKIRFEKYREKGIDVKLATDLIVGAVDNQYDTAILISSDTDLVPAIDWVRKRMEKRVEYIGFSIPDRVDNSKSTKPLFSMVSKTDVQRILVEADIKKFLLPPEPKTKKLKLS